MGTRSTVKFKEGNNTILSVYQQFDGYPSGVGMDLAKFLSGKKLVNGYQSGQEMPEYANGPGCLAAQYVAENKIKIGGFYLTDEKDEQEYNYEVNVSTDGRKFNIHVTCYAYDKELFSGDVNSFILFCKHERLNNLI